MKALANVIWYSTTFVQKSQKLLLINLLTRSSLPIWKLYPVNNPKLTEIFTPIHSRLVNRFEFCEVELKSNQEVLNSHVELHNFRKIQTENTSRRGRKHRAPFSMGAVGASAPMLFKVEGASTHTFWYCFLLSYTFERKYELKWKLIPLLSELWTRKQKSWFKNHDLRVPRIH